jgi:hypothetical protein
VNNTGAIPLRRKEQHEDAVEMLRRDAEPIVDDLQQQAAMVVATCSPMLGRRRATA